MVYGSPVRRPYKTDDPQAIAHYALRVTAPEKKTLKAISRRRREQMSEPGLTKEERLCLQMWFRQAIAKLEHEEVTAQFIQSHGLKSEDGHRSPVVRRRARRSNRFSHVRELVT